MKEYSEISVAVIESHFKKNSYQQTLGTYGFVTYEFDPDIGEVLKISKQKTDLILLEKRALGQYWTEFISLVRKDSHLAHIPIIVIGGNSKEDEITSIKANANYHLGHDASINELVTKVSFSAKYMKMVLSYKDQYLEEVNAEEQFKEKFLFQLKKIIYDNLNTSISHDVLAQELGISKSTMYRKIKEITNSTASHLIMLVKIEYSLKLLKSTNLQVDIVSSNCGFTSSSYFIVAFKKTTGYTPKQFKKIRKVNCSPLFYKMAAL